MIQRKQAVTGNWKKQKRKKTAFLPETPKDAGLKSIFKPFFFFLTRVVKKIPISGFQPLSLCNYNASNRKLILKQQPKEYNTRKGVSTHAI